MFSHAILRKKTETKNLFKDSVRRRITDFDGFNECNNNNNYVFTTHTYKVATLVRSMMLPTGSIKQNFISLVIFTL
jgi:hypothetical protein